MIVLMFVSERLRIEALPVMKSHGGAVRLAAETAAVTAISAACELLPAAGAPDALADASPRPDPDAPALVRGAAAVVTVARSSSESPSE